MNHAEDKHDLEDKLNGCISGMRRHGLIPADAEEVNRYGGDEMGIVDEGIKYRLPDGTELVVEMLRYYED